MQDCAVDRFVWVGRVLYKMRGIGSVTYESELHESRVFPSANALMNMWYVPLSLYTEPPHVFNVLFQYACLAGIWAG